jgi:hypothetical protein
MSEDDEKCTPILEGMVAWLVVRQHCTATPDTAQQVVPS